MLQVKPYLPSPKGHDMRTLGAKAAVIVLALFFALIAVSFPKLEAAGPAELTSGALEQRQVFELAPGLTLTTVTRLTGGGWLRYAVLLADTTSPDIYVGPFTKDGFIDRPATVAEALEANGLAAAVNGDFFDTATGMPLSLAASYGALLRSPRRDADFASLMIPSGGYGYLARPSWFGSLVRQDGSRIVISSFNEISVGQDDAVLYGMNRAVRKYPPWAAVALIKNGMVQMATSTDANGKVQSETFYQQAFDYELVATGSRARGVLELRQAEAVRFEYDLSPNFPMESAFSGKPVLVENGTKSKGLSSHTSIQAAVKAPRTMAGVTADGRLMLVAVEGRSSSSVGLTLDEAAELMLRLGASEAVNLDGGGSTQLAVGVSGTAARIIGSEGADRKVAYSVGVKATGDGTGFSAPPGLRIVLPSGVEAELPATGLPGQANMAYSSFVPDLPVVATGTVFLLPEGINPDDVAVVFGELRKDHPARSVVASKPGLIRFSVPSERGSVNYAALVTGEPVRARLGAMLLTKEGLNFSAEVLDSSGRQIPMPSATLRAVFEGDNGSITTEGAFIPSCEISPIGTIRKVSFYLDGAPAGKETFEKGFPESMVAPAESSWILSSLDEADEWIPNSAPTGALKSLRSASSNGSSFLEMEYDFTSPGIRAAYIKPRSPLPIPEGATRLAVLANADEASGHWLRANVRDASNTRYFLDFGRLAGFGWRRYEAALPEEKGLIFEQLYLVEFKDEMVSSGRVLLDDLEALGPEKTGFSPSASVTEASWKSRPTFYAPMAGSDAPMWARLISSFGKSAISGEASFVRLELSGGTAYKNGIAQWARLIEACTAVSGRGALIIEAAGLTFPAKAQVGPLDGMGDANEVRMLSALAERALFVGYDKVAVIRYGAHEPLWAEEHGVIYLALPALP